MFKVPEEHRIKTGALASNPYFGNAGAFAFRFKGIDVYCIAADAFGWEHVSVTINRNRCPDWETMAKVKELFWSDEATVVQFHPRADQYVNNHEYCLHLWRNKGELFTLPPRELVGV